MYEARQYKKGTSRVIGTFGKKAGGQFFNIDNRQHILSMHNSIQKKQYYPIVLQRANDEETTPQDEKAGKVADTTGKVAAFADVTAGIIAMTQELYSHCKKGKRYYIPNNVKLIIDKCNGGFVDGQQDESDNKKINNCTATLDLSYIKIENKEFEEEGGWRYFFRAYGLPLLQTLAGGPLLFLILLRQTKDPQLLPASPPYDMR